MWDLRLPPDGEGITIMVQLMETGGGDMSWIWKTLILGAFFNNLH